MLGLPVQVRLCPLVTFAPRCTRLPRLAKCLVSKRFLIVGRIGAKRCGHVLRRFLRRICAAFCAAFRCPCRPRPVGVRELQVVPRGNCLSVPDPSAGRRQREGCRPFCLPAGPKVVPRSIPGRQPSPLGNAPEVRIQVRTLPVAADHELRSDRDRVEHRLQHRGSRYCDPRSQDLHSFFGSGARSRGLGFRQLKGWGGSERVPWRCALALGLYGAPGHRGDDQPRRQPRRGAVDASDGASPEPRARRGCGVGGCSGA